MLHLFIINPTAGKNDNSKELISEIKQLFKNKNYSIELTQYSSHATILVEQYAKLHNELTVYSCGGDGTLNEVLNGIKENTNITLAIIPIGTGNDFIRNISNNRFSLEKYIDAQSTLIDMIKIENKYGLNVVSSGFDADVAKNMNRFRKLGPSSYYVSILYTLAQSIKYNFNFVIDDQIKVEKDTYLMGICANGQFYGGGMHVSPYSNINDGKLEFIRIKSISRFQIPKFMNIFIKGNHIDELKKYVDMIQCTKVKFISDKSITISIDGEIHSMLNPTIELIPKSLRIIIPK